MKLFFRRFLAIFITIGLLLTYIPTNIFAVEEIEKYTIEDRFSFMDKEGNIAKIDSGFPAVPLVLRNSSGDILDTTTTNPDGSFKFEIQTKETILTYGIAEDSPYEIGCDDPNHLMKGNNNDYKFLTAFNSENVSSASMGKVAAGKAVYIKALYGSATFTKTRKYDSSIYVEDAKYEIYYHGTEKFPQSPQKVGEGITNENGQITFNDLMCGKYSYKELDCPDEYFLNIIEGEFVVEKDTNTDVQVDDEAKCSVTLTKKDPLGNIISEEVTFNLYQSNETLIGEYKTVNGIIKVDNLHYGSYYFVETKAANGYELDGTQYHFDTGANKTTVEITAINVPWPIITFNKVDASNEEILLNGANFEIYKAGDTTPIYKSENGASSFNVKLEPGDYVIKETKAPTNYKVMEDVSFTVKSNESKTIILPNEKTTIDIEFSKLNFETREFISGAAFSLEGPINHTWTTRNATHKITNLIPGTYVLKETTVPEGFVAGEDITIVISENCESVTITQGLQIVDITETLRVDVLNYPINLTIHKKDSETKEYMKDVVFSLKKMENGVWTTFDKFDQIQCNGDKIVLKEIPAGKYILTEIIPSGYVMGEVSGTGVNHLETIDNTITFEIGTKTENEITIYNNRVYNNITILKQGNKFNDAESITNNYNLIEYVISLSDSKLPLSGATFVLKAAEDIYDPSGNGTIVWHKGEEIGEPMTTGNDGKVVFENLLFGKYIVSETIAPEGYIKGEDLEITIDENYVDNPQRVNNENEPITISLIKIQTGTKLGVKDAVYGVYSRGNNFFQPDVLVGTFTTDESGFGKFESYLPKGKYYVKEIQSPEGYILSDETFLIDFTKPSSEQENKFKINASNDVIKLTVTKQDAVSKEYVDGAVLQLIDSNNEIFAEWTTSVLDGEQIMQFKKIPAGEYTLKEIYTPQGYVKAKDITFTVEESNSNEVTMWDERIFASIIVVKTEKDNENQKLSGATFVLKQNGEIIDEGTTNINGEVVFNNLPICTYQNGKMIESIVYEIEEVVAPNGYVITANKQTVLFECTPNQTVGEFTETVKFENDYTKIAISKVEKGTNTPLEGAVLALYKLSDMDSTTNAPKEGAEPIETWTSTTEPHYIYRLNVGETYVVVELSAPDGYVKSEDIITITIAESVLVNNYNYENDYTKVVFRKYETGSNNLLGGVTFELYTKESYYSESPTPIAQWTTKDNEPHQIDKLKIGEYVLVETSAPNGYVIVGPQVFTVKDTIDVQYVDVYNDFTKVDIYKVEINTNNEIKVPNAHLVLYKASDILDGKVIENAVIIDEWDTTNDAHRINQLPSGEYVIVETSAPNGYVIGEPTRFTVDGKDTEVKTVYVENDYTKLSIYKYERNEITKEKQPLAGAHLAIYRADQINENGLVAEWITTNEPFVINKIPVGEYILREISAPTGYITQKDIPFTVQATSELQEIELENQYTTVNISKMEIAVNEENGTIILDENGQLTKKYVVGAVLGLFKAEDIDDNGQLIDGATPVDTWTTTDQKHTIYRVPVGEYYLVELEAPAGYVKGENVKVVVTEKISVQEFEMINEFTKVEINKIDKNTQETLEGATLAIFETKDIDENGNVIANAKPIKTWTTSNKAFYIQKLPIGEYTLVELEAPEGYVRAENIHFQITSSEKLVINMEDDYTKVEIEKVDFETKKPLSGAEFVIYLANDLDENGMVKENARPITNWISDGTTWTINKLPIGEYVIIETIAPNGYIKVEPIYFTVTERVEPIQISIENKQTYVGFNKKDSETQNNIIGATLQLFNANNELVDEWISDNEPHIIKGLQSGIYTLVEKYAPDGYLKAEKMTIFVKETDEPQIFDMYDQMTKISISKKDKETGDFVAGAFLQLTDKDGEVVLEWTSETTPYIISGLPIGTYLLTEKSAPDGYLLNAEKLIVIVEETETIQEFVIYNELDDYDVTIHKVDKNTQEALEGATLVLMDADGNMIDKWVSTKEPHIIKNLKPNKYTLVEKIAPEGYFIAENITFELLKNGKTENTTIIMENDYTKLQINKVIKGTENYLAGATLQIKDSEGNIIREWVTIDAPSMIYGLPAGNYVLVETSSPNGYLVADPINFTISDIGDLAVITMEDEYIEETKPPIPETGDTSNITVICIIATMSITALLVLFILGKKYLNMTSDSDNN